MPGSNLASDCSPITGVACVMDRTTSTWIMINTAFAAIGRARTALLREGRRPCARSGPAVAGAKHQKHLDFTRTVKLGTSKFFLVAHEADRHCKWNHFA
jgi:hypothetical protein